MKTSAIPRRQGSSERRIAGASASKFPTGEATMQIPPNRKTLWNGVFIKSVRPPCKFRQFFGIKCMAHVDAPDKHSGKTMIEKAAPEGAETKTLKASALPHAKRRGSHQKAKPAVAPKRRVAVSMKSQNPSANKPVNRTACKLRLQVRSGLRPPPAGYLSR